MSIIRWRNLEYSAVLGVSWASLALSVARSVLRGASAGSCHWVGDIFCFGLV